MELSIVFSEVGRETLRALDISVQRRVKAALKDEIAKNPSVGKRLLAPLGGFSSFAIGDYRIIYTFDSTDLIVHRVRHRTDVYELMTAQVEGRAYMTNTAGTRSR